VDDSRREIADGHIVCENGRIATVGEGPAPAVPEGARRIHDEEHGLYMTAGAGLYFLDGELFEVERDDFIYMAPYCPQGFTATGREPAEYLLYKDAWRDGF
jgi:(S)-ureidoglycine aminohydrolase